MGIIPSLGARVLWLLAPFPLRFPRVVLGIVQVIRAIAPSCGLGASPEKVDFELAFFTFELFDFLIQLGDALQGIAMATFPISDLLVELEVLALETLDLSAELRDLLAQGPYQDHQLPGGADRATVLYQLAVHDHLGLPNTAEKGNGLVSLHPDQGGRPNDMSWIREDSQSAKTRASVSPSMLASRVLSYVADDTIASSDGFVQFQRDKAPGIAKDGLGWVRRSFTSRESEVFIRPRDRYNGLRK